MYRTLFVTLLALPAWASAASFDGTWKLQTDTFQFSRKPLVLALDHGLYKCTSCKPGLAIKADGTDQPVSGRSYADTMAVSVIDDRSIRSVSKLAGKTMRDATDTVSADGTTLTEQLTDFTGGTPWHGTIVWTRLAPGPKGAHLISGAWQAQKVPEASDNALTVVFKTSDDGLSMSFNGTSYTAKFDGKKVDMLNDPGKTQVSLTRISDHAFRETDYRDGQARERDDYTLSDDGNSITVIGHDIVQGATVRYTMTRQSP